MAARKKQKQEQVQYPGERNELAWKLRNGTYFLTKTDSMGYIEEVRGVVSPVSDGNYVGCVQNRFGTYATFETLEQAKVHVLAVVALEGEKDDLS
jgi:hypothetical protein